MKSKSDCEHLTFELNRTQRWDAKPRLAKMSRIPSNRAWWRPLELDLSEGLGLPVFGHDLLMAPKSKHDCED